MNKKEIRQLIKNSLKRLLERDAALIKKKVREECINHKLACYLEQFLDEDPDNSPDYDVDLEYNKSYDNPKEIVDESNNKKAVRPDIIIHKRDSNQYNLIAFEIKKSYTTKHDSKKIKGFFKDPYNYSYGCLISYLPDKNYIRVELLSKQSTQNIETKKFKLYKKCR